MSKKIRELKRIPWFNICNYEHDYTSTELFFNTNTRCNILNSLLECEELGIENSIYWEKILNGDCILRYIKTSQLARQSEYPENVIAIMESNEKEREILEKNRILPCTSAIQPLSNKKAWLNGRKARDKLNILEDDQGNPIQATTDEWALSESFDFAQEGTELNICINLDCSNEQILTDLSSLLSIYRGRLNTINPRNEFKYGRIKKPDIIKIIEYKIIPLIDLQIYEKLKGVKFSERDLYDLLFPEGTELDMKRTIMSHFNKVNNPIFLQEWGSEVLKTE